MKTGEFNTLHLLRFTSVGAYLGDENDNDVLLPNKYLTSEMDLGSEVQVFLYRDSEDRLVATTEVPLIKKGEFAFLKIKEVNFYGAFADWGLEKDLMIPFKEQHITLDENSYYLTALKYDEATDRLYGTTKVNKLFTPCSDEALIGQIQPLLIGDQTDLGVKVIVNNQFLGLVYHNDMPADLRRGDYTDGYIYHIREDGKVDVRIGKPGYQRIDENADKLADILQRLGKINLTDKSSPEQVMEIVGMSKKVFKQAVGKLYKEKLIELKEDSIVWKK
jgi:predicted RNA-binding protein (virulence factor B family)